MIGVNVIQCYRIELAVISLVCYIELAECCNVLETLVQ